MYRERKKKNTRTNISPSDVSDEDRKVQYRGRKILLTNSDDKKNNSHKNTECESTGKLLNILFSYIIC